MDKVFYAFDDEVVTKFCYDIDNKKIEVHFIGYHDLLENKYHEKPCVLVIENWEAAKSKLSIETKFDNLDQHMGIFSLILFFEINEGNLSITVNMLDDRYVDLLFEKPSLRLVI